MANTVWRKTESGIYVPADYQVEAGGAKDADNLQVRSTRAGEWQAWGTVVAAVLTALSLLIAVNSLKGQQAATFAQQRDSQQAQADLVQKEIRQHAEQVSFWVVSDNGSLSMFIRNRSAVRFTQASAIAPKPWDDSPQRTNYWIDLGELEPCSLVEIYLQSMSEGDWEAFSFQLDSTLHFIDSTHHWVASSGGQLTEATDAEASGGPGELNPDRAVAYAYRQTYEKDKNADTYYGLGMLKKKSSSLTGC